jgi:putative membrane protein
MIWWWGSGWGWIGGLISAAFWIAIIVIAVILLRRELPYMHEGHHRGSSPAVRLLEERYARGEISREDFLHRREVLLQGAQPTAPPPPTGTSTSGAGEPTEKLPPAPPAPSA